MSPHVPFWLVIRVSCPPTKFHAPSHHIQILPLLPISAQMPHFPWSFIEVSSQKDMFLLWNLRHLIFTSNPTSHSSLLLSILESLVLLVSKAVSYSSLCSSQPYGCFPHSRWSVGICCMVEILTEDTLRAKLSGRLCRKYIHKYHSISAQNAYNLIGIYINTNLVNTSLLYIT